MSGADRETAQLEVTTGEGIVAPETCKDAGVTSPHLDGAI